MPTPLCVIKYPSSLPAEWVMGNLQSLEKSLMGESYFFLMLPSTENDFDAKVFFDKDIEEKKLEDIQKEILTQIKDGNCS